VQARSAALGTVNVEGRAMTDQTKSNVVSLTGDEIPSGQPVKAVIDSLAWALEAAQSGQINGCAVVVHWADGSTGHFLSGVASYSMAGRLSVLLNATIDSLKKP
jgi:hypothetical protein